MRRKKRVRALLIRIVIIILLGIGIFVVYKKILMPSKNTKVDDINGFNYTIEKRDTKLMKDNFDLLKEVLKNEEIDYEKYAEYLAKLFVIDLYTIDNKDNKYDIGGTEYIYPEKVSNYKAKVQDTLYKYLEDKSVRKQKLPEVASIELVSIEETTYDYNESSYDAYELVLTWDYINDDDYDNEATLIVMKDKKYLYIVEFNPEVEAWKRFHVD